MASHTLHVVQAFEERDGGIVAVEPKACPSAGFARALAAKLGLGGSAAIPPSAEKWLDAVAKDLQQHKGTSLVVAGEHQPAEVHALAHAINASLGNVGATLYYTQPVEERPTNHLESLRELCSDIYDGKVETLLIVGVNPVYTAPHDFDFASKIKFDAKTNSKKVKNTIYVGSHFDETAELCDRRFDRALERCRIGRIRRDPQRFLRSGFPALRRLCLDGLGSPRDHRHFGFFTRQRDGRRASQPAPRADQ